MIHELHYDNTNTYLIYGTKGLLLFDTGWAGTFTKLCKALGEKGMKLQDIDYLVISHFHPDHMGLAGELAGQGITVVVLESQKAYVHTSDHIFERDKSVAYIPLDDGNVKHIKFDGSREFLQELGIAGEMIPTPGHSEDSISLVLDSGDVFVGDLYPLYELEAHTEPGVQESWKKILDRKPKRIFYGHAKTAVLEPWEYKPLDEEKNADTSARLSESRAEIQTVGLQKNVEYYDMVKRMIRLIDKGASIDKIASKLKVDREFVSDVCRMYLTHKNVGVQGILDRIEIKGR